MEVSLQAAKNNLRQQVLARLKAQTEEHRTAASARACALLQQQRVWREAKSVLLYAPLPREPDVWPLLVASLGVGKVVALPRYDAGTDRYTACRVRDPETEIRPGHLGIREPVPECREVKLNRLDLTLVPGVAFDLRGHRLGRGGGHYDRLLAGAHGTSCGVAFDEQIVDVVPVEPHDILLNCLLTPTRWVEL